MLAKIQNFVKTYQTDIILVIGVILISLLSFAIGYIVAKNQEREPIKIEFRIENLEFRMVCSVIQLSACSSMSMSLRA